MYIVYYTDITEQLHDTRLDEWNTKILHVYQTRIILYIMAMYILKYILLSQSCIILYKHVCMNINRQRELSGLL